MSYEEEDTCHMRRRMYVCRYTIHIHACHRRRRIHAI
jgi:hypothetical protein